MKIINLHKNQSQLIAAATQNSRQAQHQLYQLYAPKMLSVCRMYIKDLHHAEEVMLDGFFKVFTHLSQFDHQGSFEGWIRRIMVRQAIDFLRKNKKNLIQESTLENSETQAEKIHFDFEVAHIQNAIDSLPEGYKMVFNLFAIEGYKHDEIAKMLKINEGTSKSQLYKARKMLQEKLNSKKSSSNAINKF